MRCLFSQKQSRRHARVREYLSYREMLISPYKTAALHMCVLLEIEHIGVYIYGTPQGELYNLSMCIILQLLESKKWINFG